MSLMSQTTNHERHTAKLSDRVAENLRAEMAAQRKTTLELSKVLHVGHRAAQNRWSGEQAIGLNELGVIARWLGVLPSDLMSERFAKAVA